MNWAGEKVLVTGGGGFIGSHLAERLVGLGATVRTFVRYNSRRDWGYLDFLPQEILQELDVVSGDLKDPAAVRRAVQGQTVVFHLGALIAIPYSYIHPVDFVQTNLFGTVHVLEACRDFGVRRLIHTSTSEVYGTAQHPSMTENHPLCAQSPYAASKIGADQMALSYFRSFGVPVSILRPFNTYGPRQSGRAVIPTIVTQALKSDEIKLGELSPIRDFCFVTDTVEGFILMAASTGVIGEVIHIGSGHGVTMNHLVKKILDMTGRDIPVRVDSGRIRPEKSEVMKLVCDFSRAKQILGWSPKIPMEEGLTRTLEWVRSHLDRYRLGEYSY